MAGASILTQPERLWINRQFRRLMETAGQRLRPINNEFNILDLAPAADGAGEVLISIDGGDYVSGLPITAPDSPMGWLVNDRGYLVVSG